MFYHNPTASFYCLTQNQYRFIPYQIQPTVAEVDILQRQWVKGYFVKHIPQQLYCDFYTTTAQSSAYLSLFLVGYRRQSNRN